MSDQVPPRWQFFLNPWWRERRLYFTDVPVEECRRRLAESTTRFIGRPVARSLVSLSDFTLHRVTFYSNGNKPYAYVRLMPGPAGGTLVRMTISTTLFGRIFFGFWFGFIGLWTLLASTAALRQPAPDWWVALFGMGMVAGGLILNAAGRLLAAGDPTFRRAFLREALELKEPPGWATPVA